MYDSPPLSPDQISVLQTALEGRYSLGREVGTGAMGVVFEAQDLKHDRKVALKILRPELAASLGTERFLREVRIEARLSHPHILPIYDSGEASGILYCVMPFVEGESLRDRLDREGQLPSDEALKICREIADALFFAHARDLIHRDVKPANILLDAGHAVLADFGLAKALSAAGDQQLTRAGFAVGTPAYASPEQGAGDTRIDGRSDLYSLGCVLYEMLAGQPPFVGPSSDSVVRQHMTAQPISVRILRPAISESIDEILNRLLAKSPADRFSSAEELIRALDAAISGEWKGTPRPLSFWLWRRKRILLPLGAAVGLLTAGFFWANRQGWGETSVGADLLDPRSIAVLYFEDLSPGGDLQHVADGLTEGLIQELNRVGEFDVASANAVDNLRDPSLSPLETAATLQAGTLIRGSLESAGDHLSVSVRLTEGNSGVDMERRRFQVPAQSLLAAQDSLVNEVAWLLRDRLGDEIRLRRRRSETSSVEAWALLQRGELERKRAEEVLMGGELERAFEAFDRADSLLALAQRADPNWVEPPILRGWVAYRKSRVAPDLESRLQWIQGGLEHADVALDLDPNLPKALELRGTITYFRFLLGMEPDPVRSEALLRQARQDLETAVDLDPSMASAHSTLSHLYYFVGLLTEAYLAAQRAYETDAYLDTAGETLWRLFTTAFDTERFPQASRWCQVGNERFPRDYRFWECRLLELTIPTHTPDVEAAWNICQHITETVPESRKPLEERKAWVWTGEVLARAGLPDSARAVLMRARAGADIDPNRNLAYVEARARAVLGDYEEAVDLLRQLLAGYGFQNEEEAEAWATHWYWRDLRGRADFERLVRVSR